MLGTCMGNRGTIRHSEVTGMQGGQTGVHSGHARIPGVHGGHTG